MRYSDWGVPSKPFLWTTVCYSKFLRPCIDYMGVFQKGDQQAWVSGSPAQDTVSQLWQSVGWVVKHSINYSFFMLIYNWEELKYSIVDSHACTGK